MLVSTGGWRLSIDFYKIVSSKLIMIVTRPSSSFMNDFFRISSFWFVLNSPLILAVSIEAAGAGDRLISRLFLLI